MIWSQPWDARNRFTWMPGIWYPAPAHTSTSVIKQAISDHRQPKWSLLACVLLHHYIHVCTFMVMKSFSSLLYFHLGFYLSHFQNMTFSFLFNSLPQNWLLHLYSSSTSFCNSPQVSTYNMFHDLNWKLTIIHPNVANKILKHQKS